MRQASQLRVRLLSAAIAAVGLGSLAANSASAAQERFDVNGTTAASGVASNGNYTWEAAGYSSTSAGTDPTPWVEGNFLRLAAGTDAGTKNYTITANNNHTFAGMFLQSGGGGTVTIKGPGILSIATGMQGFLVNSSTQKIVINAVLGGSGGVEQELGGAISLFGANTYTGGTMTTGGQNLFYNNNSSFGTGAINFTGGSGQGMTNSGPAGVTIANNVVFGTAAVPATITNFASGHGTAGAPGAIWTGTFTLPAAAGTTTIESGAATDVTEIRGVISGASGNPVVFANPGTMILSGANTYVDTTTVVSGTLKFGAANTIASTSSLVLGGTVPGSSPAVLAGGTLNPGGFSQNLSGATLGLAASSTIDFSAGAAELDLANSSALTWSGTLNLLNWDPSLDRIRFGTDASGLTSDQLAMIQFNGANAGTAMLDSAGYLVPEPASLSLLGIGAAGLLARRRRA